MVEKEAAIITNLRAQARRLLDVLANDSSSDLLSQADELLLFLNRLSDASKKYPKDFSFINSAKDIVHGLESDPQQTLRRPDVRSRLASLFLTLLQKSRA
jgi:hypothetical protein